MTADRLELAVQVAHACLARVVQRQAGQRAGGKLHRAGRQPVAREHARYEVLRRDAHALLQRVAADSNYFHAVAQRPRDGALLVGGRHKDHLGKVKREPEVCVGVRVVLRGVQHLQQRRHGVPAGVVAHLVHLVQQHHGVAAPRAPQALDHPPRHRADVRAAVPPDLRLVAHAPQRQACQRAAQHRCDRVRQAGLAHAGRADEAEDGARHRLVAHQATHRHVLQDALLHLAEPLVPRVQRALHRLQARGRLVHVRPVLAQQLRGALAPRQVGQQLHIGPHARGAGVLLAHALQLDNLLHAHLQDLRRQAGALQTGPQGLDIVLWHHAFVCARRRLPPRKHAARAPRRAAHRHTPRALQRSERAVGQRDAELDALLGLHSGQHREAPARVRQRAGQHVRGASGRQRLQQAAKPLCGAHDGGAGGCAAARCGGFPLCQQRRPQPPHQPAAHVAQLLHQRPRRLAARRRQPRVTRLKAVQLPHRRRVVQRAALALHALHAHAAHTLQHHVPVYFASVIRLHTPYLQHHRHSAHREQHAVLCLRAAACLHQRTAFCRWLRRAARAGQLGRRGARIVRRPLPAHRLQHAHAARAHHRHRCDQRRGGRRRWVAAA
mmetsp:Transcript_47263/g.120578  ORF Transcript_47263/g.120578 Transcript_47263/m.120578 type:complete len:609 (-) Transcript_47263:88-1914(-)